MVRVQWLSRILEPEGVRVTGFHGIHGGDLDKTDIAICTMEKANAIVSRLVSVRQRMPTATLVNHRSI